MAVAPVRRCLRRRHLPRHNNVPQEARDVHSGGSQVDRLDVDPAGQAGAAAQSGGCQWVHRKSGGMAALLGLRCTHVCDPTPHPTTLQSTPLQAHQGA